MARTAIGLELLVLPERSEGGESGDLVSEAVTILTIVYGGLMSKMTGVTVDVP